MGQVPPGPTYAPRWADLVVGCIVLFQLACIWTNPWFVTLDGPCHLYNARILLDLLSGDTPFAAAFLINPYPDPYWSGQLLMAGCLTVLPPDVVERGVFSLAVFGTAWAFRAAIRSLGGQQAWGILFVLPFLMHYGVLLGFINFMLSLPLLLLAVRWTHRERTGSGYLARGALLFTLLYFTHPSTFLVAVAYTMVHRICLARDRHAGGRPIDVPSVLRPLAPMAPGLLLLAYYLLARAGAKASGEAFGTGRLLADLMQGRAWNALGIEGERMLCTLIACGFFMLLIPTARSVFRTPVAPARVPLLTSAALLVLYLVVPDVVAGGSSASHRILLFLMLFLALAIAVAPQPRPLLILALVLVTGGEAVHSSTRKRHTDRLAQEVELILDGAHHLAPGSILHPISYSDNWMHSNISNYLGTVRGVIVLDNFVATAPFAPVQWRPERDPATVFGVRDIAHDPCLRFADHYERTGIAVDHIMLWHARPPRNSTCPTPIQAQLDLDHRLVSASPDSAARFFVRR